MMRRILIFVLLLAAVGTAFYLRRDNDEGIAVDVEQAVERDAFRSYVTASGEIVASRYADIGSNIMGKIISLPVDEGDVVRQGQLLARIDPVQARTSFDAAERQVEVLKAEQAVAEEQLRSTESQIERAEAVAREAKLSLDRLTQLLERGVVSKSEVDTAQLKYDVALADIRTERVNQDRIKRSIETAKSRIEQARAQKESAQDIFSKTEIRSPISGVVSRLQVREGEMVVVGIQNQPGTTLMTISDLSGINAEVKVAEADILRIKLGQQAVITLDAVAERKFEGEVVEVGTSALTASGTSSAAREFRVVIALKEPDPGLRPGLTCDSEILTDEVAGAVTVPLQAVVLRTVDGEEKSGVFLAEEGAARFYPARAGIIGGLDIVVEGVQPDAPVIAGPFQVLRDLKDGDRIAVNP